MRRCTRDRTRVTITSHPNRFRVLVYSQRLDASTEYSSDSFFFIAHFSCIDYYITVCKCMFEDIFFVFFFLLSNGTFPLSSLRTHIDFHISWKKICRRHSYTIFPSSSSFTHIWKKMAQKPLYVRCTYVQISALHISLSRTCVQWCHQKCIAFIRLDSWMSNATI